MSQTEQDQIARLSRQLSILDAEVWTLRQRVAKHDAILVNKLRRDGWTWKRIYEAFPYLSKQHVRSMRKEG
jgi:hypothetical protein